MKRYTVTAQQGVAIAAGILDLTPAQALRRAACLENLGEGLYQVLSPVMFKSGETFGFDGDINKTLLEEVTEEETGAPAEVEFLDPNAAINAEIENLQTEMKAAKDKGLKKALAGVIAALEGKLV